MKAIVQDKYGSLDVLELREIDKPLVKDDEVLVRVRAASVHPDVWHVVSGLPYVLRLMGAGLLKPKNRIPGTDVAGHVEAVGKNVTEFKSGDEVFGEMKYSARATVVFSGATAVPMQSMCLFPKTRWR
jgi:NADPH:quinone reductase-like Zn-dependent oxidoreductase